jgi:hypothetical protein
VNLNSDIQPTAADGALSAHVLLAVEQALTTNPLDGERH